ncbi:putative defensin-like protein 110 [Capsella rubella]|uniref:putative defensin-like protein 110 n=1 Tax=Capsella rubella TaxID=81985 RepID=UPI000CD55E68|nr:putative defensin-like protein 110 [Capsella rubella]
MAITIKTLIAYVFTLSFIIFYVHGDTITASSPESAYQIGHGISKNGYCFRTPACLTLWGTLGCPVFCLRAHYSSVIHGIPKNGYCFRTTACLTSWGSLGCKVFCQKAHYADGNCVIKDLCCCFN